MYQLLCLLIQKQKSSKGTSFTPKILSTTAEKKYTELRPIVIVQMGTILYRNGKKHGPIVIVQMLTILLFFFV